jgi:hypothetical protein
MCSFIIPSVCSGSQYVIVGHQPDDKSHMPLSNREYGIFGVQFVEANLTMTCKPDLRNPSARPFPWGRTRHRLRTVQGSSVFSAAAIYFQSRRLVPGCRRKSDLFSAGLSRQPHRRVLAGLTDPSCPDCRRYCRGELLPCDEHR